MKKRHDRYRDVEKLGWCGLGSLMETPQHPSNSVSLVCTVEQGSRGIICCWMRRQGYYLQIDKEAVTIYHWTRRQVSVIWVWADSREQSLGSRYLSEETVVNIFCSHCEHIPLEQRKALPFLWASPRGDFATPMRLRHWGPWHGHAHINNTRSIKISLTPYRGWDWYMIRR